MIFEVCAVLITIATIVLFIYLTITLISLRQTLIKTNEMLKKIDASIDPLSSETVQLLQHSNALAGTVKNQLGKFDPLLDSISDVGQAFQGVTASWADKPASRIRYLREEEKNSQWQDGLSDVLELAALGIQVWQNYQKRR